MTTLRDDDSTTPPARSRRASRRVVITAGIAFVGHVLVKQWLIGREPGIGKLVPGADFPLREVMPRTITSLDDDVRTPEQVVRASPATIILFLASWCAPCRQEIAAIKAWSPVERSGVGVLGICVDEDESVARGFVREVAPGFPVFLARPGALDVVGVRSIPLSVLVTSSLVVVRASVGYDEVMLRKAKQWTQPST